MTQVCTWQLPALEACRLEPIQTQLAPAPTIATVSIATVRVRLRLRLRLGGGGSVSVATPDSVHNTCIDLQLSLATTMYPHPS